MVAVDDLPLDRMMADASRLFGRLAGRVSSEVEATDDRITQRLRALESELGSSKEAQFGLDAGAMRAARKEGKKLEMVAEQYSRKLGRCGSDAEGDMQESASVSMTSARSSNNWASSSAGSRTSRWIEVGSPGATSGTESTVL